MDQKASARATNAKHGRCEKPSRVWLSAAEAMTIYSFCLIQFSNLQKCFEIWSLQGLHCWRGQTTLFSCSAWRSSSLWSEAPLFPFSFSFLSPLRFPGSCQGVQRPGKANCGEVLCAGAGSLQTPDGDGQIAPASLTDGQTACSGTLGTGSLCWGRFLQTAGACAFPLCAS